MVPDSPSPAAGSPARIAGHPFAGRRQAPPQQVPVEDLSAQLDPEIRQVLRALRTPHVWVDPDGLVLWAHPAIEAMRVVRARSVRIEEIARMIDQARSAGTTVQRDLSIRRPGRRMAPISLRVRVAPMPSGAALVLVEDVSEAERLDHVRRDFVANVSHELKTPVGALSLLAEAVSEGRDDPEAVAHFAARMVTEARRLATLVNDLMDLSRLEGIDPQHPMAVVPVDDVVSQACDDATLAAQGKGIQLLRGGVAGLKVLGVQDQLVTAVRNLIVNAVNYSPAGTRVAVTTASGGGSVTISVTDKGIGIPATELERIFERFYRVDPARSRVTGGTGLGLSIVKHVCANHGGDVEVWSRVGEGSTFTVILPELSEAASRHPSGRAPGEPKEAP